MEFQMTPSGAPVIPVRLYSHMPPATGLDVPYRDGVTSETLCFLSAKKCDIPRLSCNLFAIYDEGKEQWLAPSAKVNPTNRSLAFRMRFHMSCTPANITSLEESIVAYMFAQYRHDFLQDRISGIKMEETLGLMVLDMVRYSYEERISIKRCLSQQFKKFLPKSLAKDLTVLDKWKLKKKIRKSLGEFERCGQNLNSFRMMFLISLMEENTSWGTEEFETVKRQRYVVNIATKGIKQTEPQDQAKTFKLLFEGILSVGMIASRETDSNNWIVLVNQRENAPKEFLMEDKQKAESLVSLIDGYCRLHVDYYHYMFQDCAPPSLVQLIRNRCHGPIPFSCAKKKIEDMGPDDGIYLIRQNPEDFFSYCLTVRMNGNIRNYKINVHEDDSVGLPGQRTFPDIRSFVEHYRKSVNCSCLEGPLTKAIPYQPREELLHIHDLSALPEPPKPPPPDPPIEWIQQSNMSKRRRWKVLGSGAFTTAYRGEIRKRDKGWIQVAIKCPRADALPIIQQKFSQSVDVMSSWNNQSIVRFLGIGAGFCLIMEFAPYGPMDKFLQSNQSSLRQTHQIAMATQIMNGLEYLESRKIVHGNICAHNVLVVRSTPALRVKLGDPMLSRFYHSMSMANKLSRVRWMAPELLHSNMEPTLENDRWSFGITLWQIMAFGKIPFDNKSDSEVRDIYSRRERPPFLPNSTESINGLIDGCLQFNHTDRYTCKQLLRELNRIYLSSQEVDGGDALYWEVPGGDDDDDGPEPIAEDFSEGEDETEDGNDLQHNTAAGTSNGPLDVHQRDRGHLVKFSGINKVYEGTLTKLDPPIGKGFFGVVYRAIWNPAPSIILEVAVKELLNAAIEQREEFEREIQQMSQLDHKNIVKVLGVMESDPGTPPRLVMEYIPLGSLKNFLTKKKEYKMHVSLTTLLTFAQQVGQAMAYLVRCELVHRDLAARNVLVVSDQTDKMGPEVKISDFGLARKYTTSFYYMTTTGNTPLPCWFCAIECLDPQNGKFSSKSDVWDFGNLLWQMFSHGRTPQYIDQQMDRKQIADFLRAGNRLAKPKDCPQIIYNTMHQCWNADKHARPTFTKLVEQLGQFLEMDPVRLQSL